MLDDFTIQQLIDEKDSFVAGQSGEAQQGAQQESHGTLCRMKQMGDDERYMSGNAGSQTS